MKKINILYILGIVALLTHWSSTHTFAWIPGTVSGHVYYRMPNGITSPASGQVIVKKDKDNHEVTSRSDAEGKFVFTNNPQENNGYAYMDYKCHWQNQEGLPTLCLNTGNTSPASTSLESLPTCPYGCINGTCYEVTWCGGNCGANPHTLYVRNPTPPTGYKVVTATSVLTLAGLNFENHGVHNAGDLYIDVERLPTPLTCSNLTTSKLSPEHGDDIVFTCTGSGDSASFANFRLLRNDQVVASQGGFVSLDANKRATWTLTIAQNMPEGAYKVQCQICNGNTSSSSCTTWSQAN